jgi:hypothetical protein
MPMPMKKGWLAEAVGIDQQTPAYGRLQEHRFGITSMLPTIQQSDPGSI